MTMADRNARVVVTLLTARPDGATWRQLGAAMGFSDAAIAPVLGRTHRHVRQAIDVARLGLTTLGMVIPRPTNVGLECPYRIEEQVGNGRDQSGTFAGWHVARLDHITRLRTLVRQAEALLAEARSNPLPPGERRALERRLAIDRGMLFSLEDELAAFRQAFNGAAA